MTTKQDWVEKMDKNRPGFGPIHIKSVIKKVIHRLGEIYCRNQAGVRKVNRGIKP